MPSTHPRPTVPVALVYLGTKGTELMIVVLSSATEDRRVLPGAQALPCAHPRAIVPTLLIIL
jgi:hypothetical protein